jgi:rhodanese-related sulfurtransferase
MKKLYPTIVLILMMLGSPGFAEVIGVDPDNLEQLVREQDALVIDVRTPAEWKETGTIPSSRMIMFYDENGEHDSKKWLDQLMQVKKPDQKVILVCRSGGRSARVGEFLDREIGMKNIYHLENGITGWIEKGKGVEPCTVESC